MQILEIIVKGFVIGILVSAPMGPIGMLCVQRTLNRGRWHGFVTGMGAMLSDLVYALIVMGGMTFSDDFFSQHESLLQLLGSIVLVLFGFGVSRSNPLKGWTPDIQPEETRYVKDFTTSFFLTFSNFAIIVVYFTLFARFQFNHLEDGIGYLGVSLFAIGIGALVWWFFITSFVSRIRKHFNRRGLIVLNRTVGAILMAIGLVGIILSL